MGAGEWTLRCGAEAEVAEVAAMEAVDLVETGVQVGAELIDC